MSTSLLEALLIGSVSLMMGALLMHIRRKFYFRIYRKALANLSLGIMLMGIGGGFLSFYTSIEYERNTIIKTKVKGSEGIAVGTTAPARILEFQVEHPDVAHKLTVKPIDPILQHAFEADIYLEVISPADEKIFSAQQHFIPYTATRSPYIKIKRWRHMDTTFVPQYSGKYTLQVVPVTVDIPGIEVWILDPRKKDGYRAFSWR